MESPEHKFCLGIQRPGRCVCLGEKGSWRMGASAKFDAGGQGWFGWQKV